MFKSIRRLSFKIYAQAKEINVFLLKKEETNKQTRET